MHRITGCSPDSAVLGGTRAASSLHDARGRHIIPPSLYPTKCHQGSVSTRQAVPSLVAAQQHMQSLPTCRLPYGVFVHRTTPPRFSKIGDRSALANAAAAILDQVPQTSMCTIFWKKQLSFIETTDHVADLSPWINRASSRWINGCLTIIALYVE